MTQKTPPSDAAIAETLARVRSKVVTDSITRESWSWRRPRPMALGMTAFVVAGALTGGAVAAVANGPDPLRPADEADLVQIIELTGGMASDALGVSTEFGGSGHNEIELSAGPDGVADLAVAFKCYDKGYFSVALGRVDSPVTVECTPSPTGSIGMIATGDTVDRTLIIDAPEGARYSLTAQWLSGTPGGWEVNANGQTFGSGADGDAPDLIASIGKNALGREIPGYVASIDAFGPKQSTPEAVAEQRRLRLLQFPDGFDLPLYASDGTTVLGTFHGRVR
jgi:hypothetical protein